MPLQFIISYLIFISDCYYDYHCKDGAKCSINNICIPEHGYLFHEHAVSYHGKEHVHQAGGYQPHHDDEHEKPPHRKRLGHQRPIQAIQAHSITAHGTKSYQPVSYSGKTNLGNDKKDGANNQRSIQRKTGTKKQKN